MYDCPASAFGVFGLQDYAATVDLKWPIIFSNCVLFSRVLSCLFSFLLLSVGRLLLYECNLVCSLRTNGKLLIS